MSRVLIIAGTRPEAIKLAPLVLALRRTDVRPVLCLTGQHPRIAQEALDVFAIEADCRMECVPGGGDLCRMAAGVVASTGRLIDETRPDALIVQGDTLSAFAGGLAAALRRVPLAHVEAGLRSGSNDDPFPEEISRRQLSHIATWNFAPTPAAADNLRAEGIDAGRIHVVGNTVVDALRFARASIEPRDTDGPLLLVTAHRRENWGDPLVRICEAVRELAQRHRDWRFVFSVHPNPNVGDVVRRLLADQSNVTLLDAPRYDEWLRYLFACTLILTDSGGMQEEGCAIGRPVLVLRERTERPEAVASGAAVICGTQQDRIVAQCERVLTDAGVYARMARPRDVYGDGYASERIAAILARDLANARRNEASAPRPAYAATT